MSLPTKVNAFLFHVIHKEIFAWSGTENGIKNSSARPHDNFSASEDSKSKCNKRVPLAERCRRSRSVARGCLHLSARKKKLPALWARVRLRSVVS